MIPLSAECDGIRQNAAEVLRIEVNMLDLLPELLQARLFRRQQKAAKFGVVVFARGPAGVR